MTPAVSQTRTMQHLKLGRTGIDVSVAALGGGGASQLGLLRGRDETHARGLIHAAFDRGVTLFDTARDYLSQPVLGKALRELPRDEVVISTKERSHRNGLPITPAQLREGLAQSLYELRTDYIDVFLLASVGPGDYLYVLHELAPVLEKLKQDGKVRAFGLSERFDVDPNHAMLYRALQDDCWDVVLTGFNFLNQTARERVIAPAIQNDIGVMCMFAVRRVLRSEKLVRDALCELEARGLSSVDLLEGRSLISRLREQGALANLQDVAYRYCRHEPGVHTTLFGTGDAVHLQENITSLTAPALTDRQLESLGELFGRNTLLTGH